MFRIKSNREKREEKKDLQRNEAKRRKSLRVLKQVVIGAIVLAAIAIIVFWFSGRGSLPPTADRGHIEESPSSHIVTVPMDIRVHKHMLEHADGTGAPGVIINYDCDNYSCGDDLLLKLEEIVKKYPENVYLAPYRNMKTKIVISRLGSQKQFNDFDEQELINFIK